MGGYAACSMSFDGAGAPTKKQVGPLVTEEYHSCVYCSYEMEVILVITWFFTLRCKRQIIGAQFATKEHLNIR